MRTNSLTLRTADGRSVPARLREPTARPVGAAVLCHPHPAFGGNMDVWLLPRIGTALAAEGWAVLRFDFRTDVGDGSAAIPDLAAAVDEMATRTPDLERLALVGWSFGALVGLLYGPDDPRVTDWIGIAPPSRPAPQGWPAQPLAGIPAAVAAWTARRTVIVGDAEQFYPATDAPLFSPSAVHVVAGADHFFFDRDDEVADLVAASLRERQR